MRARELADLLSSVPATQPSLDERPSPDEVAALVTAKLRALELPRPGAVRDEPEDAEEDPRELLYWLLAMATPTYRRLLEPLPQVEPVLLARFTELLRGRPTDDGEHAQMSIDATSTLRRAMVAKAQLMARPGRVVAVGDDDATTLALALLGVRNLVALDIDERVLAFLERASRELGRPIETRRFDVFEDAVPETLEGRCTVAITDPIRSEDACLAFLDVGLRCLAPDGTLLWADHPDWNFEFEAVRATLGGQGHVVTAIHEALHEYPLTATWIQDLDDKAAHLGVPARWLRALADAVSGWTDLYVVNRRQ